VIIAEFPSELFVRTKDPLEYRVDQTGSANVADG